MTKIKLTVLIATKNEINNIAACLESIIDWAGEVLVVDSGSTDGTVERAAGLGATVINFEYKGGWPKKRQWALEWFKFRNDWVLILDADETLTSEMKHQIEEAICASGVDGYYIKFKTSFLGKDMYFGNTSFLKLCLFKVGKGRYEQRIRMQDQSMADMEIHEHVVVEGIAKNLKGFIWDRNHNSFARNITKHNEYSNWEARAFTEGAHYDLPPALFGNQAQRRRWLKRKFLLFPFSHLIYFLYGYIFKLGFLDGYTGYLYAAFQSHEIFNIKVKIREIRQATKSIKTSSA
jgi:glycosyltransferase involved in cell wall biosynthesis